MIRPAFDELADEYHLIAPDHRGLNQFALHIQEYTATIGLRIAAQHPEQMTALNSHHENAFLEGFIPFWDIRFARRLVWIEPGTKEIQLQLFFYCPTSPNHDHVGQARRDLRRCRSMGNLVPAPDDSQSGMPELVLQDRRHSTTQNLCNTMHLDDAGNRTIRSQ
ncbi:hypothetical protein GCM10027167_71420 [Nocardia heshunensis]